MMAYTPEQVIQFASPEWEQQPLFHLDEETATSDEPPVRLNLNINVEMANCEDAEEFVGRVRSIVHEMATQIVNFRHTLSEGM